MPVLAKLLRSLLQSNKHFSILVDPWETFDTIHHPHFSEALFPPHLPCFASYFFTPHSPAPLPAPLSDSLNVHPPRELPPLPSLCTVCNIHGWVYHSHQVNFYTQISSSALSLNPRRITR